MIRMKCPARSQPPRPGGCSVPGGVLQGRVAVWLVALVSMAAAGAELPRLSAEDATALHLGRRVLAAQAAIRNPGTPQAMQAITNLGLETDHYVMVRGWLTMQLQADMSLCEAWRDAPCPREVRERVEFLHRAIRAIDLE